MPGAGEQQLLQPYGRDQVVTEMMYAEDEVEAPCYSSVGGIAPGVVLLVGTL